MDDNIVLNLAEPSTKSVKRVNNGKGGRWTDRLKAKRSLKRKSSIRYEENSKSVRDNDDEEEPRPTKKPRASAPSTETPQSVDRRVKTAVTPSNKLPQIVSSLFTSNPEVKASGSNPFPRKNVMPSNAPLTDRYSFSGLGLHPFITSHLESKLNIKTPTAIQREALPPLLGSLPENTSDRDVFIQSQTGSGKTLSYLLPIVQDLLPLSTLSYIDRSIGTLAIIIAPTRELAIQIEEVLEQLLQLRLRPPEETAEDGASERYTRWLVSGALIGGATRTHEKAKLRKGLPMVVCTPGRLLDHLQNTTSFDVSKCRWLVLDEADHLMELGFEESIKGILQALEGRRKLAIQAVEDGTSKDVGGWDWDRRRRTILCSATMKEEVQSLAGFALSNPVVVKAIEVDKPSPEDTRAPTNTLKLLGSKDPNDAKFTPPSQLLQKYIVAPLKLRLVTLVALLRTLIAQSQDKRGTKIIVFLSCTDSVDFHWQLFGKASIDESEESEKETQKSDEAKEEAEEKMALHSSLLPNTSIYRLHGSLPLSTRLASLKGFVSPSKKLDASETSSSVLLCTSVAARGLDLPLVRAIVQYDLPTEGGATEYVHRVGRTARVGKGGEAWSFVAPSEQDWAKWILEKMQDKDSDKKVALVPFTVESVLKSGFGGKGSEFEERATQVQLTFERWVLKDKNGDLAKRAFKSHVRAYATHPSDEKQMFHVRHLHLGHLAKAFALREAPGSIMQKITKTRKKVGSAKSKSNTSNPEKSKGKSANVVNHKQKVFDDDDHDDSAEARMKDAVRKQGRTLKKDGLMTSSGTAEFQVAGGTELEKLVNQR